MGRCHPMAIGPAASGPTVTIKKRGVDVVPEQLRPRLGLTGDEPGTRILTRVDGSVRAFLVEPMH